MAVSAIAGLASVGSTMIAAGTFAIGMGSAFAAFALGAGLSAVSRALMPKPESANLSGITDNVRSPISSKKIIYGLSRVGGTIVMMGSSHSSGTTDNKYLTIAIAIAGHEIHRFDAVYFDDEKIWDRDKISNNGFYDNWNQNVELDFLHGDSHYSELLDAGITGYTNQHKMEGNAVLAVRLKYNQEVFTQGIPKITCKVRGRIIHDLRDGSFGFSSNPALVLLDYLVDKKYGLGEIYTNIDAQSFRDAANVCDEQIQTADGALSPRYRCDGVIDTSRSVKENIENILSSMIGTLTLVGGKYVVNAYEYKTPSLDIDESMLVDNIVVTTKQSSRNQYNGVKGTFVSFENNYTPTDYPAQLSSLYADEDGKPMYLDLTLPMTIFSSMAQRIARLTMLKSRLQTTVQMTLNLTGLQVAVGDNIRLTNEKLGYNNKIFQVLNYSLVPDPEKGLVVSILAIENDQAAYNWNTSDEIDFTTGGEIALYDGKTCQPVRNVTLTPFSELAVDGTIQPAIEISWLPGDPFTDRYEIVYREITSAKFYYGTSITSSFLITPVKANTQYEVAVFAINERGVKSIAEAASVTTVEDLQPKVPSIYRIEKSNGSAPTTQDFLAVAGRNPKDKDLVITKDTSVTPPATHAWTYNALTGEWYKDDDFITGDLIINGSLKTEQIADGAVTDAKLGDISADSISTGLLSADRINLDGLTLDSNDDGQLVISDGGVTSLQLSVGAVVSDTIADLAIIDTKIADEAVTNAKIAVDAITADVIAAGTITGVEIADDAITAEKILAGSITANEIAAGSITALEIATGTITAEQMLAGTITSDIIAANAIVAANIATDAITSDQIAAGTITGAEIAADTIRVNQLTGDVGEVFPFMVYVNSAMNTSTDIYSDEFTLQAPDLISKIPKVSYRVEYSTAGITSLQIKAKSATATMISHPDDVTITVGSGGFFAYESILTINGDLTKVVDYTGAVSDSINASNGVANIIGIRYDSANNKTIIYVRHQFGLFSQGDYIWYHKYKWASVGTFVDVIDRRTDGYINDVECSSIMLNKTDTESVFRLAFRGSGYIRRAFGTLEYVS